MGVSWSRDDVCMFLVGLASEAAYSKIWNPTPVLIDSKAPFYRSTVGMLTDTWDETVTFDTEELQVVLDIHVFGDFDRKLKKRIEVWMMR